MPKSHRVGQHSFSVREDQPLIGIPVDEQEVRYSADEREADGALNQEGIQLALSLFGTWGDMDRVEAREDLDRIRHQSQPTPPFEL